MEVIGSLGEIINLLLHIWQEFGSVKFELPGQCLMSCLRLRSFSLNDENFRTLLAEIEGVINSRLLTVETLSEVNSQIPLSHSNLLTQETNFVLPPPGNFNRPDLYSQHRWRWIQHIAGEFWSRWRNEFLQSLQIRQKWNKQKRDFEVGDIVLLKEDLGRNKWPMETKPDLIGTVRNVELWTVYSLNN